MKTRYMIQLEPETAKKLDAVAKRDGLNRSALIRLLIMRYLANEARKEAGR